MSTGRDAPGPPSRDTRVLLVDDQELVRRGFAALLANEPGIEVVGEAVDGAQAVSETRRTRPDVVLMDIRMPRMDGLAATRAICGDPRLAGSKVLVLTTFALDEYVYDALRAGASGFLLKDTPPRLLIEAIAAATDGDVLISPAMTTRLVAELVRRPVLRPGRPGPLDVLSEREREVLAEVARGKTNSEIGASLYMSPLTAKTHVSRIRTKLHARDRAQLVIIGYETGLVSPGE
ncbi:response regulator transcription factor [Phycicoccus endophyticus]|uniref:response regulator transcription factor n=1 Tax=Phycicoccus endophyticus TaxID=1690220 RepID=UPI00140E77F2|nr:response regulator transcription factor [Phycicoccus endophyticus]NHI18150.1 response regulator transcription factor [Phycicoccus endophyticus]GGL26060.1 DNA-binding response regulator [Phycicoccus endophyticus]